MRKILATALITLTLLCCFTACKKNENTDIETSATESSEVSDTSTTKSDEVIDFNTTRPTEEPSTIKPNKTIKVNVPYSLVESEAEGDIDKFAATYGYDIKEEKDGSITMKMDGMTYSFMLSRVGMSVIKSLGELVDTGYCPYIVKLADYSEDFSYLLVQVDTKKYKKHEKDMPYEDLAYIIGQTGLYYQYFTVEEENKCEVVLASSRTGKVVYSETFTD